MYDTNANASPFNPLPAVLVALVVIIMGIEVVFQLAENGMLNDPQAIGWRLDMARRFGYNDAVFEWMLTNRTFPIEHALRVFTYGFVQVGLVPAVFVIVFILALGKAVSEYCNQFALLVIFLGSSVLGALAYSVIVDENYLLFGGYPGAYGVIGAFTWIQFITRYNSGQSVWPAFRLILFLLSIQLIYKFAFGRTSSEWVAEIGGFTSGFILAIFLETNGRALISKLFSKLRSR